MTSVDQGDLSLHGPTLTVASAAYAHWRWKSACDLIDILFQAANVVCFKMATLNLLDVQVNEEGWG